MSKLLAWKKKTSSSRKWYPEKCKECLQKSNTELLELRPKVEVTKLVLESKVAANLADINEDHARIHLVDCMELENLILAIEILGQYCRILAGRVTSDSLTDRDIPEDLEESVACLCYVAGESNKLRISKVRRQLVF